MEQAVNGPLDGRKNEKNGRLEMARLFPERNLKGNDDKLNEKKPRKDQRFFLFFQKARHSIYSD
jgi:hypothetical protein